MTPAALKQLEADLWPSADTLRANSDLKASEYSTPVLGLIFLKFADNKYRQHEQAILADLLRNEATFGAALIENFRSFPVLPSADERISACIVGVD